MARTKLTARKVCANSTTPRQAAQKALKRIGVMSTARRSSGGRATRRQHDSVKAGSPLTTPPSSPSHASESMDVILMGPEEAAEKHCRPSYSHNRVSIHSLLHILLMSLLPV